MHIKRNLWVFGIIVLLLTSAVSCIPSKQTTTTTPIPQATTIPANTPLNPNSINSSLVQVWIGSELEATGIAIGDGSQVLTVIDYEIFTPQDVNVITPDGTNLTATIQQLDPRTGATLLKTESTKLPPFTAFNTESPVPEQPLVAIWWGQDYQKGVISQKLETTGLLVGYAFRRPPLVFGVYFPTESLENFVYIRQGAIITDEQGRVLGLVGVNYDTLFTHSSPPGMVPGVIKIESALELLAPDFASRPYANGPLMIVIVNELATGIHNGYFTNYDAVTEVMQQTFHRVGAALPPEELPPSGFAATMSSKNGDALMVVYPRPVQLTSENGTVLAQAKWVNIIWNRDGGQPNQLFFGSGQMVVEGGFQMPDDLSELLKAIDPLYYRVP